MQEPEDRVDFAGLHEIPAGPRFVMPRFGRSASQTATGFILESANAYLKDRGRLAKLRGTVTFIGAKSGIALAATVLVSELLDTTIADILDTVGDSAAKAAVRALHDAGRAPTEERRNYHRHSADVLLRLAFESHRDAIANVGFWADVASPSRISELHGKAVQSAVLVALLADRAGDRPAVTEWAEHARLHFAEYHEKGVEQAKFQLPVPERKDRGFLDRLASRQYNQSRYLRETLSGGKAFARARAKLAGLDAEQQEFTAVHLRLLE